MLTRRDLLKGFLALPVAMAFLPREQQEMPKFGAESAYFDGNEFFQIRRDYIYIGSTEPLPTMRYKPGAEKMEVSFWDAKAKCWRPVES